MSLLLSRKKRKLVLTRPVVEAGESLGTIHASDAEKAAEAAELLRKCYTFSDTPVQREPFIKGIVS